MIFELTFNCVVLLTETVNFFQKKIIYSQIVSDKKLIEKSQYTGIMGSVFQMKMYNANRFFRSCIIFFVKVLEMADMADSLNFMTCNEIIIGNNMYWNSYVRAPIFTNAMMT